jgi:hypothetical protein
MEEQKSAIIAKGKYALVISPPVVRTEDDKKYATKDYVLKYACESSIDGEYKTTELLRRYDPKGDLVVLSEQGTLRNGPLTVFKEEIKDLCQDEIHFASVILPHRGKTYNVEEDITIEELWKRMCKLVSILVLLKKANVIHYDIKPDNIVMSDATDSAPKGELRLLDFGSSHYEDHCKEILANLKRHTTRGYFHQSRAFWLTVLLTSNTNKIPTEEEGEERKQNSPIVIASSPSIIGAGKEKKVTNLAPTLEECYQTYEYILKFHNKGFRRKGDALARERKQMSERSKTSDDDYIFKLYNLSEEEKMKILKDNLFKTDLYAAMYIINKHLAYIVKKHKIPGLEDRYSFTSIEVGFWHRIGEIINKCIHVDPYNIPTLEEIAKMIV